VELARPVDERRISSSLARVARSARGELGLDLRLLADAARRGAETATPTEQAAIERVERRCDLQPEH